RVEELFVGGDAGDLRARAGEGLGDFAADAAARARHERCAAGQVDLHDAAPSIETTSALSSILRTRPASTLPGPNSKYFAAPIARTESSHRTELQIWVASAFRISS